MNWERILIDSVAAAIVGGAISVILIIKEIFVDCKNYKELKTKIGDTYGGYTEKSY